MDIRRQADTCYELLAAVRQVFVFANKTNLHNVTPM